MSPLTMPDPILTVEHMSMKFGGLVAIGDLSFSAERGEITALIGPNGAGKTTVFNCITGFYKPSEGMITLRRRAGTEYLLERMPDYLITAHAKVARTFQNIRLFSGMTVLENLLVAQHNKLMAASGYSILGMFGYSGYRKAAQEAIDVAVHWLEKINLVDRADDPAGDLPYGAQRRLEIARAMCTEPELLCLDEPAAGLNPRESAALNELLIDIKGSIGTSILLIEHDMSVVMEISDHIVVLEYGRKISDGTPEEVRNDPKVVAAYLGVDDAEMEDVLAEVESGPNGVIEGLDAHPDGAQGPTPSASMMAGPISETVEHGDEDETVRVSPGASKAAIVERRQRKNEVSAARGGARAASASKSAARGAARPAATTSEKPKPAGRKAQPPAPPAEPAPSPADIPPASLLGSGRTERKAGAASRPAAAPKAAASKRAAKPAEPTASKPTATKAATPKPAAAKRAEKPVKSAPPSPTAPLPGSGRAERKTGAAPKSTAPKAAASKPAAKPAGPAAPKPASSRSATPKSVAPKQAAQKPAAKRSEKPAKSAPPSPAAPLPESGRAERKAAARKSTAPNAAAAKPAGSAAPKPASSRSATPKSGAPKQAAPKPAAAKRAAKPAAPFAPPPPPDDLTLIKGIGPVNARRLAEHGITRFDQVAAWTAEDVRAVETYLAFDGRIAREDWIGQARAFAGTAAAKPKGRRK